MTLSTKNNSKTLVGEKKVRASRKVSTIKKEIKDGIIADPNVPVDPATGMPLDQTSQMDLGQPVMEPDLDAQGAATEASGKIAEMPKGGEI